MDDNLVLSSIARMTRKRPADIQGHLSLGSLGLSQSFGLSSLRSQIEARLQRRIPVIDPKMAVDELVRLVAEGAAPVEPAAPVAPAPSAAAPTAPATPAGDPFAALGIGVDLQDIGAMPITLDYRAHTFYAAHFTPAEISTALLRHDARSHLCGVFCAKEAAKKSHAALLPLRMLDISVSHDGAGRPLLNVAEALTQQHGFRFLLSISHSAAFATATCLTAWDRG